MEPIDYLRIIKRWWKLIVACVVVAAAVAWVTTPARPGPAVSTFEASHILIRDTEESGIRESAGTVALYVTAGEVPQRVADRLDFQGDPALLASEVTTEADETLGTITITVQDRDGLRAAELANAFADETLVYLTEQVQVEQQRQTDVLVERLDDLEARIAELDAQVAGAAGSQASLLTAQRDAQVRQYSVAYEQFQQLAAEGPPSPSFTSLQAATPIPVTDTGFAPPSSRAGRAAGAAGLAMVLAGLLALALERVDTKVRTKEGAERAFRLPVVAEIPKTTLRGRGSEAIVTLAQPQSLAAEAYRNLRSSLLLMPRRPPDAPPGGWVGTRGGLHGRDPLDSELPHPDEPLVVLVTSPGAGDGKTTTVANLAVAFAETGRSVLVLGADLRRPKVHTYLEVSDGPGLSDILRGGPGAPTLTEVMRMTAVPGVAMVPSGTVSDRPGELFGSRQHLIEEARELADVVLVDTAPLLLTNDAVELAPAVDAVIVVCRSGRTSNEASVRASEILARLGARVTGVALVAPPRTFSSTYYDSYYGDGRDRPGPDEHSGVPGVRAGRTLKGRSSGAANGRHRQGASPPRGG
ncbi:MAG TPA: hypothetical protein VGR26_01800 [Acidimicrobiales bacterium]|nr:hypothetical protein [Acidimicrobiales bacterium]